AKFADQVGMTRRGILNLKNAGGDAGKFIELEHFIFSQSASRVTENQAEGLARKAVVAEKAFEIGFLDADLIVDGNGSAGRRCGRRGFLQAGMVSLRAPRNRIDQGGAARAEIKRRDGSSIRRFEKSLIL